MRSFICKLVYWIMLKLYVFILWALLPLLTMGKGILIQNVVIFDGKSEKTVTGNVWIEDNVIRKVSAEPIVAGAEVEVIDGRGKFLMPGLIDAHWHAYLAANTMVDLLTAHASYTQLRAGEEAGKTLLRGFTTIRDAGGPVFGLKRAIDEGTLPGPRIYPSGAIISETGGHADFRMVYDIPEPFDCCGLTHTEKIGAAIIADGVDAVIVASRNNLIAKTDKEVFEFLKNEVKRVEVGVRRFASRQRQVDFFRSETGFQRLLLQSLFFFFKKRAGFGFQVVDRLTKCRLFLFRYAFHLLH